MNKRFVTILTIAVALSVISIFTIKSVTAVEQPRPVERPIPVIVKGVEPLDRGIIRRTTLIPAWETTIYDETHQDGDDLAYSRSKRSSFQGNIGGDASNHYGQYYSKSKADVFNKALGGGLRTSSSGIGNGSVNSWIQITAAQSMVDCPPRPSVAGVYTGKTVLAHAGKNVVYDDKRSEYAEAVTSYKTGRITSRGGFFSRAIDRNFEHSADAEAFVYLAKGIPYPTLPTLSPLAQGWIYVYETDDPTKSFFGSAESKVPQP